VPRRKVKATSKRKGGENYVKFVRFHREGLALWHERALHGSRNAVNMRRESGSGPSDLYHSSVLCARNQETYTGLLRLIRLQLELATALLMLV